MIKILNVLFLISLFIKYSISKNYLFSIIISIYNTGRYLDDSIGSVINQTVSIRNIQIILVNDGSTDETEDKCLKYKKNYPNNIIYIKIEHSGVSKARNIGIKYAKGKFINFFDSDDKWENNAFNHVLLFFRYYRSINIIGCRVKFFEALDSYHPLDYKFYRTRVVNLTKEYNCIHLQSTSSFFRYSIIKGQKFKEELFNSEDTRLINNLLLVQPLLGFIKEAIYFYRRRFDSTSAVQNSIKNEQYYFSIIQHVDEYLIETSKKLYNKILPFIQFYLAYDILWRISFPTFRYLKRNHLNKYYEKLENILNQIEDKYILEQKILNLKIKLLALSKKYNRDLRDEIIFKNQIILYSNKKLINITTYKNIIEWRILDIKNNLFHIEGKDNCILKSDKYFYFCKSGNNIYYPEYFYYSGFDFVTMYGVIEKGRIVAFNIPLKESNHQILHFFLSYNGEEIEIFPSFGWFTHIPNINGGYYNSGKYIIKYISGRFNIFKANENLKQIFEDKFCKILNKTMKKNIIKLRNNYFESEKNNKDNNSIIWIINDKKNIARDNGEYFFRFLIKSKPKGIKFYFAIKKNCSDYKRLKPLGHILDLDSEDYLNNFLKSDKLISSISESWVDNPFGKDYNCLKDLLHFDLIFIQNGMIKDDLSQYLNRITKNFRFINLQKLRAFTSKEKIIIIIPTWRSYIKGTFNSFTYESIYSHFFNSTKYFNFYNNLINEHQLLKQMKKLNYSGILCLHPYFSKQWKDFKQNNLFSVLEFCDYQNLILKSSILITDYSNIFFDFGYLKKPVIYTHFDYENYTNLHYPNGYFDYKRNGFGPVCFDQKCAIKEVISKLKDNCLLENKYLKRINAYFKYKDEKNCERLYSSLLNFSDNKKIIIDNLNNYINLIVLLFLIGLKIIFF